MPKLADTTSPRMMPPARAPRNAEVHFLSVRRSPNANRKHEPANANPRTGIALMNTPTGEGTK